jgi:hypothetical protein
VETNVYVVLGSLGTTMVDVLSVHPVHHQIQTNHDVSALSIKSLIQLISHVQLVLPIQHPTAINHLAYVFPVTVLLMEIVFSYPTVKLTKC